MTRHLSRILFVSAVVLGAALSSEACPLLEGLVDYNCDGKLRIAAVGDSFVQGIGDDKNGDRGGYVLRLKEQLPSAQIASVSLPGKSSTYILNAFRRVLSRKRGYVKTKRAVRDADYIILDLGRNDYYEERDPALTISNIALLSNLLRKYVAAGKMKTQPIVVVSSLAPSRREFQQPFIDAVNNLLFEYDHTLPLKARGDKLLTDFISSDGIHPTSAGYTRLEFLIEEALRDEVYRYALHRRVDRDGDGIYDRFEKRRFGTNPSKWDTDGDGISDGEEVFLYRTDPKR